MVLLQRLDLSRDILDVRETGVLLLVVIGCTCGHIDANRYMIRYVENMIKHKLRVSAHV